VVDCVQGGKKMINVPAFIINYNQLTLPKAMADYLADVPGLFPVIIDNASTYEPLIEFYRTCPHKVLRLDKNYGNCVLFNPDIDVLSMVGLTKQDRFIMTDPDLDLSNIPKDFMPLLHEGLDKYPQVCKAGFSLEINDLPNTELTKTVLNFELSNWTRRADDKFYFAYIDTTFCLCRRWFHDFPSVRTDRPYTARHVPWYYTKDNMPDDAKYYVNSLTRNHSFYSREMK